MIGRMTPEREKILRERMDHDTNGGVIKELFEEIDPLRSERNRALGMLNSLMNDNSLLRTTDFRERVETLLAAVPGWNA